MDLFSSQQPGVHHRLPAGANAPGVVVTVLRVLGKVQAPPPHSCLTILHHEAVLHVLVDHTGVVVPGPMPDTAPLLRIWRAVGRAHAGLAGAVKVPERLVLDPL